MDQYRKKVREAALRRDGEPLYNGSLDHAAVLCSAMFEHAGKEVSILSGKLDARVYGGDDIVEKARIFLATRGRKVRIIVENPEDIDEVDHPFLKEFMGNDDVTIKVAPRDIDLPFHFMVMDGDSYRFEENKKSPTAIAAFGDKPGGANLDNVFSVLWDRGTDWPLLNLK